MRGVKNKWFVSFQDYPDEFYPNYCAGWAYVTTISTIKTILETSKGNDYFWIDDLFVTGTLVNKTSEPIKIYNWRNNFLSDHVQHKSDILSGKFFTPELMVASDLNTGEIKHLAKKFKKCHEKQCYQMIYKDSEMIDYIRPKMQIKSSVIKDEL